MFKKNLALLKKYFVVDTHRHLKVIYVHSFKKIFARKSGRTNVRERYFIK